MTTSRSAGLSIFFIFAIPCFAASPESQHHSYPMANEAKAASEESDKTFAALMKCIKANRKSPDDPNYRSEEIDLCSAERAANKEAGIQFGVAMSKAHSARAKYRGQAEFADIKSEYRKKTPEELSRALNQCGLFNQSEFKAGHMRSVECEVADEEDGARRKEKFKTYSDRQLKEFGDNNCGMENREKLKFTGRDCVQAGEVEIERNRRKEMTNRSAQQSPPIKTQRPSPAIKVYKPVPANIVAGATSLPPDPGRIGKQTLAGVDSDNDGVRDDIQRYIALTYPASVKTRAALTQFAKGMQMELLAAASKEKALAAAEQTGNAQYCLHYLFKLDADPLWQELRAQYLNTRERSRAYGDYSHLLNGMVEQLPRDLKSRCEFDPDSLPN